MEASKFYELERLLEEFQHYMEFDQDKMVQVARTIEILKKEIDDYEVEKEECIRQDIKDEGKPSDGDQY